MQHKFGGGKRMRLNSAIFVLGMLTGVVADAQTLPIGALAHDGPATPEQLSLVVPVTGALPTTATATVRYRPAGSGAWTTGHPLLRVRPDLSDVPGFGPVQDVFAWPIIDLNPGATYDVEVTVSSGATQAVLQASFTTKSLPGPAGPRNKQVQSGASAGAIQAAFDTLNPGDVLEFQDGTYDVDGLLIRRSGSAGSPIYIRGASRNGVVLRDMGGAILRFESVQNVVLENMTLRGSGVDGGTATPHFGVFGPDTSNVSRTTVRSLTITGVNQGVIFDNEVGEVLVYDNTLAGNNPWTSQFLDSNLTWNDDGIRVPGAGNAVFNNSLRGFGDSLSLANHAGGAGLTEVRGVHFYRNDIRNSDDDLIEGDHALRNVAIYDNRSHNSMTFLSLDPLYGGPLLLARNVAINVGRTPFKWNSTNSGQFIYNNTIVMTVKAGGDVSGWYQPNNGAQRAYGYRNNILIYRGNGLYTPWIESPGHDPVDWTHNSWYPDKGVQWGSVFGGVAAAQSGIAATTPLFSNATRRFTADNVTTADPFTSPVALGANYLVEVGATYSPALSAGSAPKNSGIAIANITDGFSGASPDRGAIIAGRAPILWGDRSSGSTPSPPTDLTAN
jgi:hypothetical protein